MFKNCHYISISCCDSFFLCVKNSPINLCGFFKKIPARNLDHCTLHCVASSRLFVSVGSEIVTHRVFLAVGMNLKNGRWHPFMHVLFIKSRHWFEKKYLNVTYIQIVISFWSKGVGAGWAFDKLMVYLHRLKSKYPSCHFRVSYLLLAFPDFICFLRHCYHLLIKVIVNCPALWP